MVLFAVLPLFLGFALSASHGLQIAGLVLGILSVIVFVFVSAGLNAYCARTSQIDSHELNVTEFRVLRAPESKYPRNPAAVYPPPILPVPGFVPHAGIA
jgi:hypothetical protein